MFEVTKSNLDQDSVASLGQDFKFKLKETAQLPGAEFYFDHGGDVDLVYTIYDKFNKCKHG